MNGDDSGGYLFFKFFGEANQEGPIAYVSTCRTDAAMYDEPHPFRHTIA